MNSKVFLIIIIAFVASSIISISPSFGTATDYSELSPPLQDGDRVFSSVSYPNTYTIGSPACSTLNYGLSSPLCDSESTYLISVYDTLKENVDLGVTRDCQTYSRQFEVVDSSEITQSTERGQTINNLVKTSTGHKTAAKIGHENTQGAKIEIEAGTGENSPYTFKIKSEYSQEWKETKENEEEYSSEKANENSIENAISQMNSNTRTSSQSTVSADTFELTNEKMTLQGFNMISSYIVDSLTLVKPDKTGAKGSFDFNKVLKQKDGTLTFRTYTPGEHYFNYIKGKGEYTSGPLIWKKEITKVDCSDPNRTPLSEPNVPPKRTIPDVARIFMSPTENFAKVIVTDYDFVPIDGASVTINGASTFPIASGASTCPATSSTMLTDSDGSAEFFIPSPNKDQLPYAGTDSIIAGYGGSSNTPLPPIDGWFDDFDASGNYLPFSGGNKQDMAFHDSIRREFFINGLNEYWMDCTLSTKFMTIPYTYEAGGAATGTVTVPSYNVCLDEEYADDSIYSRYRELTAVSTDGTKTYVYPSSYPFPVEKGPDPRYHVENDKWNEASKLRSPDITISTWLWWDPADLGNYAGGTIAFSGVQEKKYFHLRVDAAGELHLVINRQATNTDLANSVDRSTFLPATGVKIPPKTWTHVAAVIDDGSAGSSNLAETPSGNTRMVLYIDGIQVAASNDALSGGTSFTKYGKGGSFFAVGAGVIADPIGNYAAGASKHQITTARQVTNFPASYLSQGYSNPYVYSTADFFNGKLDEMIIYNRPLTSSQISSLYNAYPSVSPLCENIDTSSDTATISVSYPSKQNPGTTITDSVGIERTTVDIDGTPIGMWYPLPQDITEQVTFRDTNTPNLFLPTTITKETLDNGVVVPYTGITAFDVKDNQNIDVVCDPPSGSFFNKGTTTVMCSATDSDENTASGTFKVQVTDIGGFNVPSWLKNSAGWWGCEDNEAKIDDNDFLNSLQWLSENDILVIPPNPDSVSSSNSDWSWVKGPACWWANDEIDTGVFVGAIQWLIEKGIIVV